jgi:hypothetical protein
MTPDISEFSYGFALTHELLAQIGPLRAAPIFPSLIEEGRLGGGYDVKLDAPGLPLYLQFKRSDCMTRATARELSQFNLPLALPFYRMKITERHRSAQHEMLLQLDDGINQVFYAAPRFHTITELNQAWNASAVSARSLFTRPQDIGPLDYSSHHVAFDETQRFLCSKPKELRAFNQEQLQTLLKERLQSDTRPLRAGPIAEWWQRLGQAVARAHKEGIEVIDAEELQRDVFTSPLTAQLPVTPQLPIIPPASRKALPRDSDDEQLLQKLAESALQIFGAQFFVVQNI